MDYSGDDTDQYCKDCRRITQTVLDHRQGDTICSECGLVLEAYFVDTTAEWRTFADSDNDPVRVGDAESPLLPDRLGTVISDPKNYSDNNPQSRSLGLVNKIVEKDLSGLERTFKSIADKAYFLSIEKPVIYRAQQIYKEADDKNKKFCKAKNKDALALACLFLACKDEGKAVTFKHIASDGTAVKKDINKICKELRRLLELSSTVTSAKDLTAQCCSDLGMNAQEKKALKEALDKLEEFDIRRNPTSSLAGLAYMFEQLSDNGKTIEEVSRAAGGGVAVATTKKAYKDLYPYAEQIIPSWFAKSEDIKKLRNPCTRSVVKHP